mmetsp:Transcript_94755/g.267509  ORF Transcript_94755/g.267509 Transcript_94755/m.267509 type:complete len:206 (-) Transcript_94755:336-953(-)
MNAVVSLVPRAACFWLRTQPKHRGDERRPALAWEWCALMPKTCLSCCAMSARVLQLAPRSVSRKPPSFAEDSDTTTPAARRGSTSVFGSIAAKPCHLPRSPQSSRALRGRGTFPVGDLQLFCSRRSIAHCTAKATKGVYFEGRFSKTTRSGARSMATQTNSSKGTASAVYGSEALMPCWSQNSYHRPPRPAVRRCSRCTRVASSS